MSGVRVDCPDCGDVSVSSDAITLRPCVDDAVRTSYNFGCPKCGGRVAKPCSPNIARLILGLTNVQVEPWFLPADLFLSHEGPPITADDVIEFHQAMNPT